MSWRLFREFGRRPPQPQPFLNPALTEVRHTCASSASAAIAPTFALFAWGYPAAQGVYCADHIGPVMVQDQSTFGATPTYKVVAGNKPCRVCDGPDNGEPNP